jgi:phosphocarrier protein HPr
VVQTSSDTNVAGAEVALPENVDLHARPAADFVRAAMRFSSEVSVAVDGREVDAKSLLSILALGARRGTSLRLRAEGEDATAAIAALVETIATLRE